MKKLILSVLLVLVSFCVNAQSKSSVTTANLNLRSATDLSSYVIDVIPMGTEVTVLGVSEKLWSLVIYKGQLGWARSTYLRTKYVPTQSGVVTYYTNSRGERVQSPTYYSSVPKGATARCKDGTYSFSRSRRGTCSHHGGVAYWLN